MIGGAEWIPLAVAVVAGASTIAVQLWIGRGEPAAIKQIKLLNEAIAGMPADDPGAVALIATRSALATRLARSLVGKTGFAKVLRRSGWLSVAIGSLTFIAWVVTSFLTPGFGASDVGSNVVSVSLMLFAIGPALLFYSALWPQFNKTLDSMADLIQTIRTRARAKK